MKNLLKKGIWGENPITYHVLGVCSALAVTSRLSTAVTMSVALVFVLAGANVLISLLRFRIPQKVRIIIQLIIISALVIVVDQFLKAFFYDIGKAITVYVGLIITNCIVLGRAESFAMSNPPLRSFWDGIANGLGYGLVLIMVAAAREIAGSGSLFGLQVIPDAAYKAGYVDCGLMALAPGAFFLVGGLVWLQKAFQRERVRNLETGTRELGVRELGVRVRES